MINPTIIKFDEIESTSDLLKNYADSFPNFTIVSAGFQTKGRGQFDHTWESNKNENLLISILLKEQSLKPSFDIKNAILQLLNEFFTNYQINVQFKEPNDLFYQGKKICGILIETRYEESKLASVVIGLGININQQSFSGFEATSLSLIKNEKFEVEQTFDEIVKLLIKYFK